MIHFQYLKDNWDAVAEFWVSFMALILNRTIKRKRSN